MGEGEGVARVGKETGGSEKSFCRDTVPRRVVGRCTRVAPLLENMGPVKKICIRRLIFQAIDSPANSPSRRFTSSSPLRVSSSVSTGAPFGDVGDSGVAKGCPTEAKNRARGCLG